MALTRAVSDFKDSVKAATTSSIYLAGGAPSTVDGVSIAVNDSILVRCQSNPAQNGIYRVTTLGTGNNGTWSRRDDFNDYRLISPGALTFVENGNVNGNVFYYIAGNVGVVDVGTTPIIFSNLYTLFASELDIESLLTRVTTYGNANVAAYLPLYTGNINAGNVTITSNLTVSNLTVSGIATFSNTEYVTNVEYSNLIVSNVIVANSFYAVNDGQFVGYLTGAIGANGANTGEFTTIATTSNVNIGGNISITGNIIPSANVTYNIGSPNFRFKDLYLSGTSLDLDGTKLSVKNGTFFVPSLSTSGGQLSGYLTGAIGANVANSGVFTSLVANNGTLNTLIANSVTANNSGQIKGYLTGAIGANLANSAIFTTVFANSVTTTNDGQLTGWLTGAIGANLANTGTFTTLTVNDTTDSTSIDTGAFQVLGGAGITGNIFAGNVYSYFYWPNGKSILDTSDSTLTVANLVIQPGGSITYGDGTAQTTRAPKLYTNWDDFSLTELHPGDFWYDDGTGGIYPDYASGVQSIFMVVTDDDGSGTGTLITRLLDMTIRS